MVDYTVIGGKKKKKKRKKRKKGDKSTLGISTQDLKPIKEAEEVVRKEPVRQQQPLSPANDPNNPNNWRTIE